MRRSPASARPAVLLVLVPVVLAALVGGAGFAAGHGIDHLSADPQVSADGVVRMESVFATRDGFVVVYRDGGEGDGTVLAHRPFSASTRDVSDVPVRIPAERWAALPENATLRAVLHGDDGDGTFDPATDPPLASFGGVAGDSFVVGQGPTVYVGASSGAGIQRSADGVVEVRSVRLPERGHVVLRNSSGGVPAEVVGVTTLDAGSHANVSVALEESFFADRPVNGTFSVWAHVYRDDGDGVFDADDRPIRAGNETVGTRFGVERVLPGRTPTPTPEEGSLVRTATPSATATGSPTTTGTPTAIWTEAAATTGATATTGTDVDGDGFGVGVALAGLSLLAAVALVRRRLD
jgi:hypothetical protein